MAFSTVVSKTVFSMFPVSYLTDCNESACFICAHTVLLVCGVGLMSNPTNQLETRNF
jgi:hypothetical protein